MANEIDEVIGIMNGTTNYILTKMFEDNMDFDEALAKATELGYAEADPTADIEGLDAGRKAAILASIAFHSRVVFKDVYTAVSYTHLVFPSVIVSDITDLLCELYISAGR